MASSGTKIARRAIEEQTIAEVCRLLEELGNARARQRVAPLSHLERDLGLGSLERIELMSRLDAAFELKLPEEVFHEAASVADLIAAVELATSGPAESFPSSATPGVAAMQGIRSAQLAGASRPSSTARDAPRPGAFETLIDVIQHRGTAGAERPHIYLRESGTSERVITFGALLESAEKIAGALEFRGLEPGQTVAIMLPTCTEFFFTFFGIMLAGGIPVPIYPPYRAGRIEEYASRQAGILANAEARFLITNRAAERVARLLKPQAPSLRGVVDAADLLTAKVPPGVGRHRQVRREDIAFLQYTSGSTGAPKGVIVTHANLVANLDAIGATMRPAPSDAVVSWLPLYHDMGLIGAWFFPLYFGLPLTILSPLAFLTKPESWLWAIHERRATLTAAPNFAYELCVRKIQDRDIDGLDLSSVRAMLNGAETVYPETLDRFSKRFERYGLNPNVVLPVYGLAEATLGVSASEFGRRTRVDLIDRALFEREGRAVPAAGDANALAFVSAGVPLPGIEVRVANSDGSDAGERREGELWFRGPATTRGYYRNPEATREIKREGGWVASGDRAYRSEGELFITGRNKDIIIKGGRNLYPHEVEAVAAGVEGVRRGCVVAFGAADERSGTERMVIVAEVRNLSDSARVEAAIIQRVTDTLGMPPDVVKLVGVQSIPKTSSGKLRRAETRKLYLEGKLGSRAAPAWLQVARVAARGGAARFTGTTRALLRRALDGAYGIYALGVLAAWAPSTTLLVMLAPSRHASAVCMRQAARALLASIGCRVRVEGRERLEELGGEESTCVFASNHSSYLDVLLLISALPCRVRFSSKIEVRSWPFVGLVFRKLGQLGFERNDPQARLRQAEDIEHALRQGQSIVVFPEGTFTPADGLRPFQLGAFKAAVAAGKPVCPVALRGARLVLRDGTFLPKPGRITLTFCAPLNPAENSWSEVVRLRDATRAAIAPLTGEPLLD